MRLKKQPGQFLIACFGRIVDYFDRLGVTGLVRADLLVSGIVNIAAGVADRCRDDTGDLLEVILRTPETARSENRPFGLVFLFRIFLCRSKIHRNRVHTVARILWSIFLTGKDMPEMSTAIRADDFRPTAVGIRQFRYGQALLVVKARPAARRLEFGG